MRITYQDQCLPTNSLPTLGSLQAGQAFRFSGGEAIYLRAGAYYGRMASYMNSAQLSGMCVSVKLDNGQLYLHKSDSVVVPVSANVVVSGDKEPTNGCF